MLKRDALGVFSHSGLLAVGGFLELISKHLHLLNPHCEGNNMNKFELGLSIQAIVLLLLFISVCPNKQFVHVPPMIY